MFANLPWLCCISAGGIRKNNHRVKMAGKYVIKAKRRFLPWVDNTGFLQSGKLRHRVVDTGKNSSRKSFPRSLYFLPCLIPNIEEGNGTQRPKHLLRESKWTKKTFTDTISVGKILQFVKMKPEKRKFKEINSVQFLVKLVDLIKL